MTLLDRRNHHVFQPLLYQVATATLSAGDIAVADPMGAAQARNRAGAARRGVAHRRGQAPRGADRWRVDRLRLADRRHRLEPCLLRAPGVGAIRAGTEDARGCVRDPAPRSCSAFERAEREADDRRRQELLTFVLVGGGPTGVELAGTLAEIARQTLRDEFRSIDTATGAHRARRGGSNHSADVSREAARRGASLAAAARRRGAGRRARHRHRRARRDHRRRRAADRAGTVLWTAGVAASPLVATLGVPLDRAGRVHGASPICPFQGTRRSSSWATRPRFIRGAACCPASRRPRCRGLRTRPVRFSSASKGKPSTAVRLSRLRATWRSSAADRRCRSQLGALLGRPRLAVVALPAHLHAHRLPQPRDGAAGLGGRVPDIPAQRASDHRVGPIPQTQTSRFTAEIGGASFPVQLLLESRPTAELRGVGHGSAFGVAVRRSCARETDGEATLSIDARADGPGESASSAGLRYVSDERPGIRRRDGADGLRDIWRRAAGRVRDAVRAETDRRPRRSAGVDRCLDLPRPARSPSGHWTRRARAGSSTAITAAWRACRDETKFDRLQTFAAALPGLRSRTDTRICRDRGSRARRCSPTVVQLLERSLIRVGNDEYARQNHSFGLTTLRDWHVRVTGRDAPVRVSRQERGAPRSRCHRPPSGARRETVSRPAGAGAVSIPRTRRAPPGT